MTVFAILYYTLQSKKVMTNEVLFVCFQHMVQTSMSAAPYSAQFQQNGEAPGPPPLKVESTPTKDGPPTVGPPFSPPTVTTNGLEQQTVSIVSTYSLITMATRILWIKFITCMYVCGIYTIQQRAQKAKPFVILMGNI